MKILLIGSGRFGQHYLRILKEKEMLYGVVTKTVESAERIKKESGIWTFTEVTDSLLDRVDAVMIVTPSNTHYELIKKILPKNPVFCEKPLALESNEIKELINLEKKTGNKLMVGHIYRFNNAIREIKKIIIQDDPKIVKIRFLGGDKNDSGVLHEFMHGFDIMLNLFGKNFDVVDRAIKLDSFGDAEYGKIEFKFERTSVLVELGWFSKLKIRDLSIIFEDKKLYCDLIKQTINYDNKEKNYYTEPLIREINYFIDICNGQDLKYPDATLALQVQNIIDFVGRFT
jgi:UDP-N-acetylglucosamine 3-dehydrogenase